MLTILHLICGVWSLLFSTFAVAADWKYLGPTVWVDTKSIRRDTFPKFTPGVLTIPATASETYRVAWMRFEEKPTIVMIEVIFDCHGGMKVMQQLVTPATNTGPYKTYDLTQDLRTSGVPFKSIAPDSPYDMGQEVVCK
jgi:hypothetical protein